MKRIRIIIGSYPQLANLDWYTSKIITEIGYIDNRIEIKKNLIYKYGYKSRALLIHITILKAKETDKKLQ